MRNLGRYRCSPMSAGAPTALRELYRWQLDALVHWLRCGRRGVIEAVTGSGKTDVAIAAAADALRRGRFVLVLVPSRVLMEQWHGRLTSALPTARIGRLGDSGRDRPASCDVLVLPSRTTPAWKEQYGRILIEALACGAMVAGSDSGEIPNVIRRTGGGVVFREGDPEDLLSTLRKLVLDRARIASLAEAGRRYVESRLTHDAVALELGRGLGFL